MWPQGKTLVADWCSHYPRGVPSADHAAECDAPLMLIGEAPGSNENKKGIPFVGAAGFLWERELLEPCGLSRSAFYITNVLPYQPPGNKLEVVWGLSRQTMLDGIEAVREKAKRFGGRILVPTGNTAMSALTGLKGIMKW